MSKSELSRTRAWEVKESPANLGYKICSRDPETARKAMAEHIKVSGRRWLRIKNKE